MTVPDDTGEHPPAGRNADPGNALLLGLGCATVFGITAIVFYVVLVQQSLLVLGIALLLGLASFAVGALVGFLFGVPRSLSKGSAATTGVAANCQEHNGMRGLT